MTRSELIKKAAEIATEYLNIRTYLPVSGWNKKSLELLVINLTEVLFYEKEGNKLLEGYTNHETLAMALTPYEDQPPFFKEAMILKRKAHELWLSVFSRSKNRKD